MYLLCEYPEIQNELYKEQCAILSDINSDPSFKQIQEMNYLERTIKESQRILPCVISFSRKMTADIQLKTSKLYQKLTARLEFSLARKIKFNKTDKIVKIHVFELQKIHCTNDVKVFSYFN